MPKRSFSVVMDSRDRNQLDEEIQDRNLNKMKVLSSAYFNDEDGEENRSVSDVYYPISTVHGRGIRSEFYPGRNQREINQGNIQESAQNRPFSHHASIALANPTKTCFPLFVGGSGLALSLVGLTAYWIVQIPSIRQQLGKIL